MHLQVEYWLALIKVITALGLIVLNIVIALGGGPTHDRLGFRYWISTPSLFRLAQADHALLQIQAPLHSTTI